MVVGVFGGFNVQQAELRILGAPPLAARGGGAMGIGEKNHLMFCDFKVLGKAHVGNSSAQVHFGLIINVRVVKIANVDCDDLQLKRFGCPQGL